MFDSGSFSLDSFDAGSFDFGEADAAVSSGGGKLLPRRRPFRPSQPLVDFDLPRRQDDEDVLMLMH